MNRLQLQMAPARSPPDHISLESARLVATALDLVGLPAAVLGAAGRWLAANATFEGLMPHVATVRRDRLQLTDAAADALLNDAVAQLAHGPASVRSIPIPAAEGRLASIVHVIPIHGSARERLPGARAIVVAIPVAAGDVPTRELLQGLFNLTPAEARVARAVAVRRTVDDVATAFELSRETVRSQLKAARAKIGVARNIDLAVLLACAGLHRFPDAS